MATGPSPLPDASRPATPTAGSDWPAQAADTIERAVGSVRDKTTGPAITVARALVYGTFALLVGTAVAIMLAISGVRALDVYLPDAVVGEDHTWVAHAIIGGIFTILGMVLWSQRAPRGDE